MTMSMTINISYQYDYQYRLHYETDSGYGDEHRDTVWLLVVVL